MQYRISHAPHRTLLAIGLVGCIASSHAAEATAPDATDLDDVVVTATRTAQTQDATLAAVDVITRADIERLQPRSLPDLLRSAQGVGISNSGGAGKLSSAYVRGTNAGHVLVLVDGLQVGSATAGTAALQDIPVEQIERIEIVRGPFSSLYGSEAIGGVIQIFTRRPQSAFSPTFSVGAGNYATYKATAGVSGRSGDGWYALNVAHDTTDGINACRPSPLGPFGYTGGCFTDEPDRDGYTNNSVSARGGYRFGQLDVELKALRAEGENEYDGNYLDPFFPSPNESKVVQQVGGARARYQAGDAATFTLNLGQSLDRSRDFGEGEFFSLFETRRNQGSLQADVVLGGGTWSAGFDWSQDKVDSTTPYAVDERTNRALFGQWQQSFGAHSLQVSARHDDNSQFGGETTGSALWGWDFTQALRLTASYGTAFKAPTFNDLYYPLFDNPALQPETSRSAELGLRGKHGWGGWSVNAFQTRIEDLIVFDGMTTDATHPFGMPINVGEARIRGVELSGNTRLAGWDLRGTASWLDPRSESAPNDGNVLPRRARRSGRLDADRAFGNFSVGASVTGASRRFDELANVNELGGYATTDLRAGFRFGPDWSLALSVNNVFDKSYETVRYFNQLGRNYLLTLSYHPAE